MYDSPPETFDALVAPFPAEIRDMAVWLRDVILAEFPQVEENVSDGARVANALYGIGVAIAAVVPAACGEPTIPESTTPFALEPAYSFDDLAPGDFVVQFDFTTEGALWAITFEGTVSRTVEDERAAWDAADDLGGGHARDLFIDGSHRVWLAVEEAFAVYDDGEWRRHEAPDELTPGKPISQIAVNDSDDVLIAAGDADGGGLPLLSDGAWQAFTPASSDLPSPIANEIAVGPDGEFWVGRGTIGGKGGVSRLADGTIRTVYTTTSGLLYDWVDALAPNEYLPWIADDHAGDVHVAAADRGIIFKVAR